MNTVVALSTPRGRGALAVIRLSGPQAIAIALRLARVAEFEPRHATLTKLRSVSADEVLRQSIAAGAAKDLKAILDQMAEA